MNSSPPAGRVPATHLVASCLANWFEEIHKGGGDVETMYVQERKNPQVHVRRGQSPLFTFEQQKIHHVFLGMSTNQRGLGGDDVILCNICLVLLVVCDLPD